MKPFSYIWLFLCIVLSVTMTVQPVANAMFAMANRGEGMFLSITCSKQEKGIPPVHRKKNSPARSSSSHRSFKTGNTYAFLTSAKTRISGSDLAAKRAFQQPDSFIPAVAACEIEPPPPKSFS